MFSKYVYIQSTFPFKLQKEMFVLTGNPQEEKQDTFVEKLVTQIIKNLQVKISEIHIRYEDDVSIVCVI